MSFDNNLQVIVSKVVSDNPKAPPLRVQFEVGGVKYQAGVWPWKKKDGSPVLDKNGNGKYIGTAEVDNYEPKQQQTAPPQDDFDDDIPF